MCEDSPVKRTCEFMLSSSSKYPQRACHPEESFISKGPHMTLRLGVETSTVLRPVEFKLYYEFVNTKQDGESFLPAYLSHQTALNLFSAPNLPRPFVSSSSTIHIGKVASGINSMVTGNSMGSSRIMAATNGGQIASSLGSIPIKRSNSRTLRLAAASSSAETSSENININSKNDNKSNNNGMMNTAPSSSASSLATTSDVGISGVSSFTASRLSSGTNVIATNSNDDSNHGTLMLGDDGQNSVIAGVGPNGNNFISDSSIVRGGAMSSFGSSNIDASSYNPVAISSSSSSSNHPSQVVAASQQMEAVAAASISRESLPISPKQSCSRIFRTQNRAVQAGSFTSPRNVFFFGRGGVRNLTCIYRFQGGPNEKVRLTIDKISLDGG